MCWWANGFVRSAAAQHVARAREANVNRELPTTSAHPASTSYGPTVVVPYASRVNVPAAMHAMLLRNWAMALPLMAGARDARAGEDAVCWGRG